MKGLERGPADHRRPINRAREFNPAEQNGGLPQRQPEKTTFGVDLQDYQQTRGAWE
jgi:hypothetical protein